MFSLLIPLHFSSAVLNVGGFPVACAGCQSPTSTNTAQGLNNPSAGCYAGFTACGDSCISSNQTCVNGSPANNPSSLPAVITSGSTLITPAGPLPLVPNQQPAPAATAPATTQISTSFDVSLKYGSTGDPVEQLQDFLQDQGFYQGKMDGKFGLSTMRAVMAFQKANSLNPDGYFGKASRAKANSILATILQPSENAEQAETGTVAPAINAAATNTITTSTIAGCTSNIGFSSTTGHRAAAQLLLFQIPPQLQLFILQLLYQPRFLHLLHIILTILGLPTMALIRFHVRQLRTIL